MRSGWPTPLQTLTRDLLRQYAYLGGDAVVVTDHNLLADPAKLRTVLKYVENKQYNTVVLKMGKRAKVVSLEGDMAELDLPRGAPQNIPGAQQALPSIKDYKGEEAISTAIKQLLDEATPKIYFLSDSRMGLGGIASSYSELVTALQREGFEVEFWDLTRAGRLPGDADIIGLVNPRSEVSPQTADLLYEYVRGGGQLFINVHYWEDPVSHWNVALDELGTRFGFELSKRMVCHWIVDPNNPRQVRTGDRRCQNLDAVNMNPAHPVTRPLLMSRRYPVFKIGREIRQRENAELEGIRVDTSFLRTDRGAWLEDAPVDYYGPDPSETNAYRSRSIGAVIDVDPRQGDRTGHVVVLGAEGLDNFSFEFNGDFALNLFNWMAEREALVSIRGRKYVSRRLELEPQQLDRIGTLLMAGVPGILFVLGMFVFWRRRRV